MNPKYKRILLKVSGEALSGGKGTGLDSKTLAEIAQVVKKCADAGVEIAIVVGGGNFWRGRASEDMNRTRADHIGMLATVMNSLALQSALETAGVVTRVQTAIEMRQIAEPYIRDKAMSHLNAGKVVIFGCGTADRFLGYIQAQKRTFQSLCQPGRIIAFSAAYVQDLSPDTQLFGSPDQGVHNRGVVTRFQEFPPGQHLVPGISGVQGMLLLDNQQIQIALTGQVKGMVP